MKRKDIVDSESESDHDSEYKEPLVVRETNKKKAIAQLSKTSAKSSERHQNKDEAVKELARPQKLARNGPKEAIKSQEPTTTRQETKAMPESVKIAELICIKEPVRPRSHKKARQGTEEVWNLIESLDATARNQTPSQTDQGLSVIDPVPKKPSYEERIRREEEETERRLADERARHAEHLAFQETTMEMIENLRDTARRERIRQRDTTDFAIVNPRFERASMNSFEKQWKNPLRSRRKDMAAFYNNIFPITMSPFENFKRLWTMREEQIRTTIVLHPPSLPAENLLYETKSDHLEQERPSSENISEMDIKNS